MSANNNNNRHIFQGFGAYMSLLALVYAAEVLFFVVVSFPICFLGGLENSVPLCSWAGIGCAQQGRRGNC